MKQGYALMKLPHNNNSDCPTLKDVIEKVHLVTGSEDIILTLWPQTAYIYVRIFMNR